MRGGASKLSTILSASALLAAAASTAPSTASTPPLIWTGAERLGLLCLVQTDHGTDAALADSLCDRARALAARGAPVPASIIPIGDPAVIDSRTVTLLVHASVEETDGRRLLAFTIRPYRSSADQNAVLFGATPRVAALGASGIGTEVDAALRSALAEVLPWQNRSGGARPLPQTRNHNEKKQLN